MIETNSLRQKILDLAIRGKLTQRLDSDGTAKDLLAKIKAEKQKLITEGKIKKEKPLAPITDDEKPFEIPGTWEWAYIGDVFQHNTGKALNASDKNGELKEYITTSNLYWNRFELANLKKMPFTEKEIEKCTVVKGDILVCEGGDYGRCAIWRLETPILIQNHIHRLRAYYEICSEYFYYIFFLYKQKNLISGQGIGIQGLSSNALHNMLVPLPPLAEQKRIVEIIESLDEKLQLIDSLQLSCNEDAEILKSKLISAAIQGKLTEQLPSDGNAKDLLTKIKAEKQKLITEGKIKKEKPLAPITDDEKPFEIPENWEWVRLGEVGVWSSGATPSRGISEYYKNGNIPWLKTGDLNDGLITEVPEYITQKAVDNSSMSLQPKGAVLIAMYGATIGKLGVLDIEATTNQACCACAPYSGLYNWYLFYALLQHKDMFIKQGAGGAQTNISKEKIVNSIVPLPPLAEQKRIVEKLEELATLCGDFRE